MRRIILLLFLVMIGKDLPGQIQLSFDQKEIHIRRGKRIPMLKLALNVKNLGQRDFLMLNPGIAPVLEIEQIDSTLSKRFHTVLLDDYGERVATNFKFHGPSSRSKAPTRIRVPGGDSITVAIRVDLARDYLLTRNRQAKVYLVVLYVDRTIIDGIVKSDTLNIFLD